MSSSLATMNSEEPDAYVSRIFAERVDESDSFIAKLFLKWFPRLLLSAVVMTAWMGMSLLFLALVLPLGGDDAAEFSYPTNRFIQLLTILYIIPALPMALLPLRDDDLFIWLLHAGYGWALSFLGAIATMWYHGMVTVEDIWFPMEIRPLAAIIAGAFLVPMVLSMVLPVDMRRRLVCLVTLLIAWLLVQGGSLALMSMDSALTFDTGYQRLGVLLVALLCAAVIPSLILPDRNDLRYQLVGFVSLLWLFSIAAIFCYQVGRTNIAIVQSDGQAEFVAFCVALFVAPFFSWLGMPWLRHSRLGWGLCLGVAGLAVLAAVWMIPIDGELNLIQYVWKHYDGPHLIPQALFS